MVSRKDIRRRVIHKTYRVRRRAKIIFVNKPPENEEMIARRRRMMVRRLDETVLSKAISKTFSVTSAIW